MPKCPCCGESVNSFDLSPVDGSAVCGQCSTPHPVPDLKEKRTLATFAVREVPTSDGKTDHEFEVASAYGGLELKFSTTFDEIRDFFTRRREKRE